MERETDRQTEKEIVTHRDKYLVIKYIHRCIKVKKCIKSERRKSKMKKTGDRETERERERGGGGGGERDK